MENFAREFTGNGHVFILDVYYSGNQEEASRFHREHFQNFSRMIDLQIYNHLPLYIRNDVLKGKHLYSKDNHFLHDVAYQTIKEFEDFKKYYYDYIGMEMIT